ncbi:MAG TPA: hypothetical protein VGN72_00385 [Tepidisphaeraceae bacterium]|jgi:hypothetical protein|nr:hypothetical protein [Tepidisphaeraceae bacterium]
MKRQITASMLSVAWLGLPVLVGCDDTIASKETTKTSSDGTEIRKETEVKERPDGTIVKEETKTKTDVD